MRDFNFFESFEQQKKRQEGPAIRYPFILVLVVLAAAAWPAWNFYQLYQLHNEITFTRNQLETDPRYPLFDAVIEKQEALTGQRQVLDTMKRSAELITEREVIDELLMFTIATAMPEDSALNSMSISGRDVQMQGVAGSKPAIAELEFNIRQTGRFEQIFIPSMSENEGMWQFNMSFRVKGGEAQ